LNIALAAKVVAIPGDVVLSLPQLLHHHIVFVIVQFYRFVSAFQFMPV